MNFRLTVALLAVLVVLGGVVFFSERSTDQAATPTPRTGERVFTFETKNVSDLAVNWSGKQVTLHRDTNGQWQITTPERAPADNALEGVVANLGRLNSTRDIVVKSSDLPSYGLDRPQATITITMISGESQRLLVGATTPNAASYYTRRPIGDDEVVVRVAPAEAIGMLKDFTEQPPKAQPTPTQVPATPQASPTP